MCNDSSHAPFTLPVRESGRPRDRLHITIEQKQPMKSCIWSQTPAPG